jgi:hypothetical protein
MWGAWAIGMATTNSLTIMRFERLGMGAIAPTSGIRALEDLLLCTPLGPQVACCISIDHVFHVHYIVCDILFDNISNFC